MAAIQVKIVSSLGEDDVLHISPEILHDINNDRNYIFSNVDTAEYYFVQLKAALFIKRFSMFLPKRSIIFLKSHESVTAHAFLAEFILQVNPRQDLLSAGELLVHRGRIISWNLKSGSYWKDLGLSVADKQHEVGLPLSAFKPLTSCSLTAGSSLFNYYQYHDKFA